MGGSQSREGLDLSESSDYESDEEQSEEQYEDAQDGDGGRQPKPQMPSSSGGKTLDELDEKLKALKLKYPSQNPSLRNAVKLYLHIGGNTPKAKWVVSDKLTFFQFVRNDDESGGGGENYWVLEVGSKIRAKVSTDMQLKMFGDQRRVDFVWNGVWALKFFEDEEYRSFVSGFQDCLFENVYGLKPTDENKIWWQRRCLIRVGERRRRQRQVKETIAATKRRDVDGGNKWGSRKTAAANPDQEAEKSTTVDPEGG